MSKSLGMMAIVAALVATSAMAAAPLQQDKPIEISSDKLDVFQEEHKAIFSGNVIAIQGTTNMRAAEMVVFYRDNTSKGPAPAADATGQTPPAQGIYRIESQGSVVFTTPTETALGDKAVYNVDTDTIDLFGSNVTLTRGQNILKGTKLNYNMTTGRSVLTGGASGTAVAGEGAKGGKGARVHGLFIPKSTKDDGGKK